MNKEIKPFDLQRMLFGDAPPWFLFEVMLRGLVFKIAKDPPPGLPVYPPDDNDIFEIRKKADDIQACAVWGFTSPKIQTTACSNCVNIYWVDAVN